VTPNFTKGAVRDLKRLAKDDATAIIDGIERFCVSGIGDVKKLHDVKPPTWRLRVGKWRALYRVKNGGMLILSVTDRRDAYR
jgi:mRNA-degrading endonuclease RelE of RelBE toxin-antitoxin system